MTYNFDEIINRHGTNCLKHDFHLERHKPEDLLSLWVADMDFKAPIEIRDAMKEVIDHGIFGYTGIKDDYYQAVHSWFLNHFNWDVKQEWMVVTPGVVYALNLAVRAYTKPGDSILIQRPVYYPFSKVIELNDRKLINNSLIYENNSYHIDFEALEAQIIEHDVRMFIFCSPHNPVGRVWTTEELLQLGDLCLKHHVILITDEIHADFTYPGHKHTMIASLSEALAEITVTCTAPSKTFNLAGLQISNIFIPNKTLRDAFCHAFLLSGYSEPNIMGITACKAAYSYGDEWLSQLLVYLKGNIEYMDNYLKTHLPKIKMVETQGTYLVWLDFSAYNLSTHELEDIIVHKAKLWLDGGTMFGPEGTGFQRINVASPRTVIAQAMHQLREAFEPLN